VGTNRISLERLDHLLDVVELRQVERVRVGPVPLDHQRAGGVDAHHRVVDAGGREGGEDRLGVSGEVAEQVEHLVAEGGVEAVPPVGHRLGDREPKRAIAREPAGVVDRPRGGVVSESLGDPAAVGEQA
jgi:hypothetical protein